jgi:hypothetical protein
MPAKAAAPVAAMTSKEGAGGLAPLPAAPTRPSQVLGRSSAGDFWPLPAVVKHRRGGPVKRGTWRYHMNVNPGTCDLSGRSGDGHSAGITASPTPRPQPCCACDIPRRHQR